MTAQVRCLCFSRLTKTKNKNCCGSEGKAKLNPSKNTIGWRLLCFFRHTK